MSDAHADLLLLLAVRLRSRGNAASVADCLGSLGGDVESAAAGLGTARALGQVRERGEESRWSLTPAGVTELAAQLAQDTLRVGRADLGTAYEAFLPLNRAFLSTLTSSREIEATDLDVVRSLVVALDPILDALLAWSDRFGSYGSRLAAALTAAHTDRSWIASPTRDSVHTIWFELHEHLLATLGRDRRSEANEP
ncbi:MAG: hypothetical protein ACI9C1_000749 [Candidatus Aldehydirespiratoraceae bacterium]